MTSKLAVWQAPSFVLPNISNTNDLGDAEAVHLTTGIGSSIVAITARSNSAAGLFTDVEIFYFTM